MQGEPATEADSLPSGSIRVVIVRITSRRSEFRWSRAAPSATPTCARASSSPWSSISALWPFRRWGRENPIGRRIPWTAAIVGRQIVGVVGDVKEFGPSAMRPTRCTSPMEQSPNPGRILVRSVARPATIAGLHAPRPSSKFDPQTAITNFETLEQAKEDAVAIAAHAHRCSRSSRVLALVIAVAGITSMLALWVRQRKREIGIRMALGASPRSIVKDVLRQGMLLVGSGSAVGVAGALETDALAEGDCSFRCSPRTSRRSRAACGGPARRPRCWRAWRRREKRRESIPRRRCGAD